MILSSTWTCFTVRTCLVLPVSGGPDKRPAAAETWQDGYLVAQPRGALQQRLPDVFVHDEAPDLRRDGPSRLLGLWRGGVLIGRLGGVQLGDLRMSVRETTC